MSFVKSVYPPISFVINSVFRPWRLAYSAADRPADAPPIIMTSHFSKEDDIETLLFYLFIIQHNHFFHGLFLCPTFLLIC